MASYLLTTMKWRCKATFLIEIIQLRLIEETNKPTVECIQMRRSGT